MRRAPTLLALMLAAAFGGFAATALREGLQAPAQAATAASAALPAAALPGAVGGQPLPSLAPMLAKVTPAVVSVHATQRVRVSPFAGDPIFERLFPELSRERLSQSLGSGVIVDAQRGYVLTNHHVIENANEVSVTLADGRTLPAEFIGSDPETDVAVMRIPAKNLTALALADSDRLRVGDFVVAVGNPFGIGQTVTSGIVSAVGRSGLPGIGLQNFIQTDASINPGNSGGALVNLEGQLVGINTASFNPRGSMAGNIGLGFAIPSNLARSVAEQLIGNDGVVRRGTLGVDAIDVDAGIARQLGLGEARGAAVTRVLSASAAAAAGIKPGDVIVGFNGQAVSGAYDLRNLEGLQRIGAPVTLEVIRDGKTLRIASTVRELTRLAGGELDPRLDGAELVELPADARRAGRGGVRVASVARGSRAAANGLREGDVVEGVNRAAVADLSGFRATFTRTPAQLVLQVRRGSTRGMLPMQ